ncbi:Protein of unknown function [Leuconostoc citreum]|nr:Protein of unknown function [Leuconostoc citreum]
MNVKVAQSNLS